MFPTFISIVPFHDVAANTDEELLPKNRLLEGGFIPSNAINVAN